MGIFSRKKKPFKPKVRKGIRARRARKKLFGRNEKLIAKHKREGRYH